MKALAYRIPKSTRLHIILIGRDIFWTGLGISICIAFLMSAYQAPMERWEAKMFLGAFLGFAYTMWKLTGSPIGAIFMCLAAIFPLSLFIVGPQTPHLPMETLQTCRLLMIGVGMAPILMLAKAYNRKLEHDKYGTLEDF